MSRTTLVILPAVCLATSIAWAAAASPFIGEWKLNPSKSRMPDEMKVQSQGGNRYAFDFGAGAEVIAVDGTDQPGYGGTLLSVKVDAPDTWIVERKKDGRLLLRATWKLSKDGRTLTDHFREFGSDGSTLSMDYVYQRSDAGSGFAADWQSIKETMNTPLLMHVKEFQSDGLSFITPLEDKTKNVGLDGKDYPNDGPNAQRGASSSGQRVDERTLVITDKVDGKVTDTEEVGLSADLKTLTITVHVVGRDKPTVLVFDRMTVASGQEPATRNVPADTVYGQPGRLVDIQFDEPETLVDAVRDVYDHAHSPTSKTSVPRSGAAFRECSECPEMVIVPAGRFVMGSSDAEKAWTAAHGGSQQAVSDEAPQHEVRLPAFALGRYDVTRGEYAAFVRATGHPSGDGCGRGRAIFKWQKDPKLTWNDPGFAQTDRDPVVCVSWNDAQAYVAWLNTESGHAGAYHLPSESECEYAARAGTTTKFYWGDDDDAAPVHAWFNANSGCQTIQGLFCDDGQTHPVGAKPPNAFGLYDMAGHVWQWTADCYDNSYAAVPADGRANDVPSSDPKAKDGQGHCLRVDRGGSWMFPAWLLRPATRERNPAAYRNVIMGFRVARTLS